LTDLEEELCQIRELRWLPLMAAQTISLLTNVTLFYLLPFIISFALFWTLLDTTDRLQLQCNWI